MQTKLLDLGLDRLRDNSLVFECPYSVARSLFTLCQTYLNILETPSYDD